MELLLTRIYTNEIYTIGHLYIDGKYFCDTLEDCDRGLDSKMSSDEIKSKKVYAKTAIPTGMYKVSMNTVSPAFKNRSWAQKLKGIVPRLQNVPGYEGVLIHVGNTASDTSGCILVGKNTVKGKVTESTVTYDRLTQELIKNPNNIVLTIKRNYSVS